jgi:hypothetical protein
MNAERVAPGVGVGGCLVLVAALFAPVFLISDPGTGLGIYYGAGPVGGAGTVAFLALLSVVAFLAGTRGRTDAETAAGIALVVGVGVPAAAVLWAVSVEQELVFSFPAAWMGWHRWAVVAVAAVPALAAAVYTAGVLRFSS